MTISVLFKIAAAIFVIRFIWKSYRFLESLKGIIIFIVLFILVTIIKFFITQRGSSRGTGSSGRTGSSGGTSVTVRYLGKRNGVDTYDFGSYNAGNTVSKSVYEWIKDEYGVEHLICMFGEDVLKFSVGKYEDGSFRIKMSLRDDFMYKYVDSIEAGKRSVENAIKSHKGHYYSSSVFDSIYRSL